MTGKAVKQMEQTEQMKQMKQIEQGEMRHIELRQIKVEDDFWSARQQLDVELSAIPYYAWGNRGINQMAVWMHETL